MKWCTGEYKLLIYLEVRKKKIPYNVFTLSKKER